jgi:hypothetical protein
MPCPQVSDPVAPTPADLLPGGCLMKSRSLHSIATRSLPLFFVAVVAVMAWAPVVWASGGPPVDPDVLGIYVDEAAELDCLDAVTGAFSTYLVVSNLTSEGVLGWEAKVSFEGGAMQVAAILRGQAINVAWRDDEYVVGLAEPLMTSSGTVVLMEMTMFVLDPETPVEGFVANVYTHTGPELLPYYLDAYDAMIVKPLFPASGDIAEAVFEANVECHGPVALEPSSWGSVKVLFR